MNMKKIAWQKYEDYIEKQVSSPILNNILNAFLSQNEIDEEENLEEEEDDDESYEEEAEKLQFVKPILPLTEELINDISMLSSFDCWIGHTNFDITYDIKNKIEKIEGIEMLKVWTRYRFFIGIGIMFDFKDVRQQIENIILGENNVS